MGPKLKTIKEFLENLVQNFGLRKEESAHTRAHTHVYRLMLNMRVMFTLLVEAAIQSRGQTALATDKYIATARLLRAAVSCQNKFKPFSLGFQINISKKLQDRRFFFFCLLEFVNQFEIQILGACWYLLSIERQEACWRHMCSLESPSCQYTYFDCHRVTESVRNVWFMSSNVTNQCNPDSNSYPFGIFGDAVTSNVTSALFFNKYFYCLWWGLKNLR